MYIFLELTPWNFSRFYHVPPPLKFSILFVYIEINKSNTLTGRSTSPLNFLSSNSILIFQFNPFYFLCRRIKKNSFQSWINFVREEKEERVREKRRAELRRKVQGWLPDFNAT